MRTTNNTLKIWLNCPIKLILGGLLLLFSSAIYAEEKIIVGLTADIPYAEVKHKGNKVRIKRIQNKLNKLTGNFSKTSRPCPPFCIAPIEAAPNVKTVGELELIKFLQQNSDSQKGLLIDARLADFYDVETIPGAINIPFTLFTSPSIKEVVLLLGVTRKNDEYDFSDAKILYLFCNGPWCEQSPRAIKALIDFGYPATKLYYYRGGMQLWKLFSLTTVLPQPNKVNQ
ncbi:MAG TPA: rhodanese-like domain-containing protein [Leucothrix mucor]|uniref:Rhodanese-like domain-containing protein n=1 Tax=Leucothrix mucor TaxID=45248 RepID=A0A7V2WUE4_LEUMU|nr:rhodanese-like domain-containing protein [Leucothrix mucor]